MLKGVIVATNVKRGTIRVVSDLTGEITTTNTKKGTIEKC